jgi:hypothetical protein
MSANQKVISPTSINKGKMINIPTIRNKELHNAPLLLFQPFNIIVFLSFFSPIIIATIVTATSFMSQNVNGFVYLGFLLAVVVARSFIYLITKSNQINSLDGSICTSVQYSKYGNSSFSSFVIAFTMMYLFLPMFLNDNANYFVFSILVAYFFLDIFVKTFKKCITSFTDLILNILLGFSIGAGIVSLMYAGGSGQYLFFDSSSPTAINNSSNGVKCNMPSKQTFKCAVYKNGQLVNSTTTSS